MRWISDVGRLTRDWAFEHGTTDCDISKPNVNASKVRQVITYLCRVCIGFTLVGRGRDNEDVSHFNEVVQLH